MADLSINLAGIKSPNPLWVASGPQSNTAYQCHRAFEAGWGGVVWKTIGDPIVNVSSIAGLRGARGLSGYSTSKFGLRGLTRTAAMELGHDGIRVNAVCPGVVDTEMTRRNAEKRASKQGTSADEVLDSLVSTVPLRRAAAPEEIAEIALHLLGDGFGYVTGQAVNVCGGLEFN